MISTYSGSGYPVVLWGSCFLCVCVCMWVRTVLLLCPLYNLVGVVLLSFFVCGLIFLLVVHKILCYVDILCCEGRYCQRSLFVTVFHYNDVVLSSWL